MTTGDRQTMTSPWLREQETFFERHRANPLLTAEDWPYAVNTVFNAGATLLADGTTLLLCRVEDRRGVSHLCAARSSNGVDGWVVDPVPTLLPNPDEHPEEKWGVEDPRITWLAELGRYAVVYTNYSQAGPGVSLAFTQDFHGFERYGEILPAGRQRRRPLAAADRPELGVDPPTGQRTRRAHLDFLSPDLRHWGSHKLILQQYDG